MPRARTADCTGLWTTTTPSVSASLMNSRCGEVEADEVYVVAGHKSNPAAVQKKAGRDTDVG
jgi:hypothetical protein